MKKKIVLIFMCAFFTQSLFVNSIMASDSVVKNNVELNQEMHRKDVIEFKTRVYNGITQIRRWNRTQNCWVDPEWISLSM